LIDSADGGREREREREREKRRSRTRESIEQSRSSFTATQYLKVSGPMSKIACVERAE